VETGGKVTIKAELLDEVLKDYRGPQGADAWDKEKADPKGKPQQAPSLPPDLHAVTEANRQAVVSCGCAVSCRVVSETVCHL
jgi:hypothetical protein